MKVRVKFSKHGALKFIGHLDVMRFFQKAIRRAELDVAYTGGFSPHQIMTFAAPLGVGLESNGEYMDIEVNYEVSDISANEIKQMLNAQMVDGIEVLEVTMLPDNAGNAMASVAAAAYKIYFRDGYEPAFDLKKAITEFCNLDEIIVTKKTKKSEATFDMKPYIFECRLTEDEKGIYMIVDASSAGNIKPNLVVRALYEYMHADLNDFALLITREETYTDIGDEENRSFVSLSSVGKDF